MNKKNLLLVIPLLFLLTGCPYYSKIPLSVEPKTPIDTLLLGTWKVNSVNPDSSEMRIYAFNKMEYYIELVDTDKGGMEIHNCRAFITPVGTTSILNFEELKNKGTYMFFRYKINKGKLELSMVSDEGMKETYSTSKELWKAFSKRINDSTFYESSERFVRKK